MASSRATLQTERERVCVERDTDSLYSHSSLLQSPRFDRIISENLAGNMHPAMWPRISFAGRAQFPFHRSTESALEVQCGHMNELEFGD
ncbi:hypothetical protein L1887_61915 [Cichorium endivia]|nr:hypothetical protein L1887_61915 [Cichorium endivia]